MQTRIVSARLRDPRSTSALLPPTVCPARNSHCCRSETATARIRDEAATHKGCVEGSSAPQAATEALEAMGGGAGWRFGELGDAPFDQSRLSPSLRGPLTLVLFLTPIKRARGFWPADRSATGASRTVLMPARQRER